MTTSGARTVADPGRRAPRQAPAAPRPRHLLETPPGLPDRRRRGAPTSRRRGGLAQPSSGSVAAAHGRLLRRGQHGRGHVGPGARLRPVHPQLEREGAGGCRQPVCLPLGSWRGRLSQEERKMLDTEREAFFDATVDLRRSIYQKKMELKSEMAKNPLDTERALAVQKELSELKSQMAQKRLEHRIKLRQSYPDLGPWMGKGKGRGSGGGYGGRGGCPRWQ